MADAGDNALYNACNAYQPLLERNMAKIRDKAEDSARHGQFKTCIYAKELGVPEGKEECKAVFDVLVNRMETANVAHDKH
jgi:hypothetical protein